MNWRRFTGIVPLLAIGLLAGCGPGIADLPLPGTTVPGKSYLLTAEFKDALNLAVGAKVKVNGVDVGRVTKVEARDFHAVATLRVEENAGIHLGATAQLRYNTPLGELFVDVRSPRTGVLIGPGSAMTTSSTSTAPTVEDMLASVSLLVNGGGLGQVKTITDELNTAIGGRGPAVRKLLQQTDEFLRQANGTTGDFDNALNALAGASKVLNSRRSVIAAAIQEVGPAAGVLHRNTARTVALLKRLVALSRSANGLAVSSRTDILTTIRELAGVMATFYQLHGEFGAGLDRLSAAARFADHTVPGDWVPLYLSVQVAETLIGIPGLGTLGLPTLPNVPKIPLPSIPTPPLPPLPHIPGESGLSDLLGLNLVGSK